MRRPRNNRVVQDRNSHMEWRQASLSLVLDQWVGDSNRFAQHLKLLVDPLDLVTVHQHLVDLDQLLERVQVLPRLAAHKD